MCTLERLVMENKTEETLLVIGETVLLTFVVLTLISMIIRRIGREEWLEYRGPTFHAFVGSICLIVVIMLHY